jgi:hypothetical protein
MQCREDRLAPLAARFDGRGAQQHVFNAAIEAR